MGSRQTKIESLPPKERAEQEAWAQEQLQQNAGVCVAGFAWYRIEGGYRCHGGNHMVADELLAEGKGGYYCRKLYNGVQNYKARREEILRNLSEAREPSWEGAFYSRI